MSHAKSFLRLESNRQQSGSVNGSAIVTGRQQVHAAWGVGTTPGGAMRTSTRVYAEKIEKFAGFETGSMQDALCSNVARSLPAIPTFRIRPRPRPRVVRAGDP